MTILICDDEKNCLDILKKHVQEYMYNRYIECEITALSDPAPIIQNDWRFDLAFLDIQMEGMDGISLAKELKKRNHKLALFFVTNYDEYQDDAMDLQAFRFFEKPFDVNRLYSGLDKAMEYIDGAYVDVFLQSNRVQQRVLVDNIMYITRVNRKIVIFTPQGEFASSKSFDEWWEALPPLFFYPVHKSYLVNLHYIDKYAYSEIFLLDHTRIPVAPRRQTAFHKFWFAYLRRR